MSWTHDDSAATAEATMPRLTRHIRTTTAVLLAAMSMLAACASAEREMIPVEQVVTYSEKVDYEEDAVWAGETEPIEESSAAECQEYRDEIEVYQTAHTASVAVGALGLIAGLVSDDETVQKVAGIAGTIATLAQAGTATAAEVTATEAEEKGCRLP